MMVCEYVFKEFYSHGSDEYLNNWASQVDRLASQGWEVLDSTRNVLHPGHWTVVLVRPAGRFRKELEPQRPENPDASDRE